MTLITGLHHAAVNVSDWDRSIRFYRDVLGLELVFQDGDASGEGLDENTRLHGVHLRFGMFRCGSDFFELIRYREPPPAPPAGTLNDTGKTHLCFRVPDIEAAYRELVERGVAFNGTPIHIDSGPLAGWPSPTSMIPTGSCSRSSRTGGESPECPDLGHPSAHDAGIVPLTQQQEE